MTSLDQAIVWLEKFQLDQYCRLKIPVPDPISIDKAIEALPEFGKDADRDSLIRSLVEIYELGRKTPGSRYDSYIDRGYLCQIGQELEKIVPPASKFQQPIFGTSPLLSPNAMVAFPGGQPVVIFQRGQFHFFTAALRALMLACPIRKPFSACTSEELEWSDAWYDLERLKASIPWMMEAILVAITFKPAECRAIINNIYGSHYKPGDASLLHNQIAYQLQRCVYNFVVGHEYSHIIDRMNERKRFFFGPNGGPPTRENFEIIRNMTDEMLADNNGVRLGLKSSALQRMGPENSYLGVSLFFDLIALLDAGVHILRDGVVPKADTIVSPTHPPLTERREEAEKVIASINGNPLDTQRGRKIAESLRQLLFAFWINMQPVFLEWHKRGLASYLAPEYRSRPLSNGNRIVWSGPK